MIKQEGLYQNKVNSSLASIHNCKIACYVQFHCLDLDLWLANFKICFVGGLGSCGRTVSVDRNEGSVFGPSLF